MRTGVLLLLSALGCAPAMCAQLQPPPEFRNAPPAPPSGATITFRFQNPQLQPADYTIVVHSNGEGHFVSHVGSAPPDDIANLPAVGQERDITVTDATLNRMFAIAAKDHQFAMKCENGGTKVAFQGTKTLSYEGPNGKGSCTFNYSADQRIEWISAEMMGLATTLEEGRRLAVEHEHGRLSLDAELETLTTMVKEGQATQLQNIAPILQVIVSDDDVMVHARRRAQAILDTLPAPPAVSGAK